ncbi:MAG: hypothetical protein L0L22_00120 [Staphylococcus equorum]|uniref:Uncharacterized protein n=1 Tax=Lactococcus phage P1048 TaxID=2662295 RepID=A0A649V2H7_9CAUD|nr:hypothetical protein H1Z36_gp101 [Lactococcus phage P1048]MDN6100800.1 hypothetical protein [Lactococcus lactis]MDN6569383.1 hypothetical protein [Staphylococcus equorum]MDN6120228.1 hypothetical protein [Lactococcus lactis]MDN6504840.1 hypothetical protein [Lactococcus lactis]MDN6587719.1 hypothetical protein [Lactococcus lactis]
MTDKKIVDITQEEKPKKTTKAKTTKTTAKKETAKHLTPAQIQAKIKKSRGIMKVGVTIDGEEFYYNIDTVPTESKKAEIETKIRETLSYFLSEDEKQDGLIMELYKQNEGFKNEFDIIAGSFVVVDILAVFSDFEVGETIEDKQNFLIDLMDVGIFNDISENLPESIQSLIKEITDKISRETDEITKKTEDLRLQIEKIEKDNKK